MLEFRELFSKAKHIAVITGAGVSAESGVPTFRGENEKWRKWLSQVFNAQEDFMGPVLLGSLHSKRLRRGTVFPNLQERFDWTETRNVSFLCAGPGNSGGLLSKPVAGLGVLPIQEGRGFEQEAQRRPSGHSGVRGPAEEAGALGGRHHAVHR